MKDFWKDIQSEIQSVKEPLSENAWAGMEKNLKASKPKRKAWFIMFPLSVVLVALAGWYQPLEKPLESEGSFLDPDLNPHGGVSESPLQQIQSLPDTSHDIGQYAIEEVKAFANLENTLSKISAVKSDPDLIVSKAISLVSQQNSDPLALKAKSYLPLINQDSKLPDPKYVFEGIETSDTPTDSKDPLSRFELRIYAGTTYSFGEFDFSSDPLKTNRSYEQATSNSNKGAFGFDFGAELKYRLHSNLKIGGGIGYRKLQNFATYNYEINEIPVILSSTGEIQAYIPLPQSRKVEQEDFNSFEFINIPLSLYYERPLNQKWQFSTELIHYFGILVQQNSNRVHYQNLELTKSSFDDFNRTLLSYQIRLGFIYKLKPGLSLAIEPSYRSYYKDLYNTEAISWKPQDLSLNFSAIIHFTNPKP